MQQDRSDCYSHNLQSEKIFSSFCLGMFCFDVLLHALVVLVVFLFFANARKASNLRNRVCTHLHTNGLLRPNHHILLGGEVGPNGHQPTVVVGGPLHNPNHLQALPPHGGQTTRMVGVDQFLFAFGLDWWFLIHKHHRVLDCQLKITRLCFTWSIFQGVVGNPSIIDVGPQSKY